MSCILNIRLCIILIKNPKKKDQSQIILVNSHRYRRISNEKQPRIQFKFIKVLQTKELYYCAATFT